MDIFESNICSMTGTGQRTIRHSRIVTGSSDLLSHTDMFCLRRSSGYGNMDVNMALFQIDSIIIDANLIKQSIQIICK